MWPTNSSRRDQGVADDGRAQVPDVHLLGDVRRRVVDHDALCGRRGSNAETLVAGQHAELLGQERIVEGDVDEARAGHLDGGLATEIGSGDDLVGDVAWLAAQLLRQGERAVGLGVGSIARSHHRIDRDDPCRQRSKRRCKQLGDDDEGISHERSIVPVQHSFDMPRRRLQMFVAILADIPPS